MLREINDAPYSTTFFLTMSPSFRLFSFLGAAFGGTLAAALTATSSVSNTS